MKEYVANVITSVFPFGVITKGEFLTKEQTDILGEEILADMVRRGVITEFGDEADTTNAANDASKQREEAAPSSQASKAGTAAPPEAPDGETGGEDDEGEGLELEPDTMDDVVDDAEEASAAETEKPKKNSGRRKAE